MNRVIWLSGMLFVAVVGWRVGESLSGEAIAMAIGVLFGVMAAIPTGLLFLASQRRDAAQPEQWKQSHQPRIEQHYHYHAPSKYRQDHSLTQRTGVHKDSLCTTNEPTWTHGGLSK